MDLSRRLLLVFSEVFFLSLYPQRDHLRSCCLTEPQFNGGKRKKPFTKWMIPFVKRNHGRRLTVDELPGPPAQSRAQVVAPKLQARLQTVKANFRSACWEHLRKPFFLSSLMYFIKYCVLSLFNSLVLWVLVSCLQDGLAADTHVYAGALCLSLMASTLLHHHMYFYAQCHSLALQVATRALVYRQVLRSSKAKITAGHLLNVISADAAKFEQVSGYFMCVVNVPFLLAAAVSCLLWLYGVACMAGIAVYVLMALFQLYQGKLFKRLRRDKCTVTDERLKITGAILSSMRIVKLYNWEKPMQELVASVRRKELKITKSINALRAFNMTLFYTSAKIALFATIATEFLVFGRTPRADTVFVVFSLFNVIRISLAFDLPGAIERTVETLVSVQRIQKVLTATKAESETAARHETNEETTPCRVLLDNVMAVWDESGDTFKVQMDHLAIDCPALCVITGAVGSGKTSFLMAVLREMHLVKGTVSISGSIAYVPQDAWLFPGTIRQNILFGKPHDEAWYDTVVHACVLHQDFDTMPHNDLTNVGDRGITLSGGQKARINLARAVYRNADVYVFDDPLSAVDDKVAKHLISNCLCGVLAGKLILLATHQMAMLKHLNVPHKHVAMKKGVAKVLQSQVEHRQAVATKPSRVTDPNPIQDRETNRVSGGVVVEESAVPSGGVRGYADFLAKGNGAVLVVLCAALNLASQICFVGGDVLVSFWANASVTLNGDNNVTVEAVQSPDEFLSAYATLTTLLLVTSSSRAFLFFSLCLRSSAALHDDMIDGVLRAKMFFFDSNPVGRILNRFSKDLETVDDVLPGAYLEVVTQMSMLFGVVVVVGFANYWLLLPIATLTVVVTCLGFVFFKISRNLKEIEAVARSSVYAHFNSSVEGQVTIRSFDANETLGEEFDSRQNVHSAAHFTSFAFLRWFSVWLDFSFNVLTCVATATMLLVGGTTGTDLGLVLSTLFSVGSTIPWVTRLAAELQTQMVSYERIVQYTRLEREARCNVPTASERRLTKSNVRGRVAFSRVSLCYDGTQHYVLKSVSFCIEPGEKVGVVGRTGAGKSSLVAALFRLVDVEGTVSIDDVDISQVSPAEVRALITVIPQDPVLFTTSVRSNLDPFGEHADEALWHVLESVRLKDVVKGMPNGLQAAVDEGGANFSVGQRQLLCLARVLLGTCQIVVLDEATSSVDARTRKLMNGIMRKQFSSRTVLTIAHRLDTILGMDKVIVMDNGSVIEFGNPKRLLEVEGSRFRDLATEQARRTKLRPRCEGSEFCTRL